jgi:hypothetical protein
VRTWMPGTSVDKPAVTERGTSPAMTSEWLCN